MDNALPRTVVEILDTNLNKIAEFKALYPLNKEGHVLQYSAELSNYGHCRFRVSPLDPIFTQLGDFLVPHQYHIRLKRGNTYIWQGAVIDIPHRTKNFIEVLGAEYDWYMDKILIKRTSAVGYNEVTPAQDIGLHYRIFSSGTMADAINTILTEFKSTIGPSHVLANMNIATVENPNFPPNATDANGAALTGPWTFGPSMVLQFDYVSVLFVLQQFGIYANADFIMDSSLNFYFKNFIGNKDLKKSFVFSEQNDVIDFDLPRKGSRMINDLFGIATQTDGTILHAEVRDEASIAKYGLLQGAMGFIDIKDVNILTARLNNQLRYTSTPDSVPLNFVTDEKTYPIGEYGIGDLFTAVVNWGQISYNAPRRLVGYTVLIHETGREFITLQTNVPRPQDLGA